MFHVQQKVWFKLCAGITASLMGWSVAQAAVEGTRASWDRSVRLDEVAKRLGLDPARVRGGAEWKAASAAEVARRREAALARLREKTGPATTLDVDRRRREIEAAHRPALLAGLARAARSAGEAVEQARDGERSRRRLTADAETLAALLQRVGAVDAALSAPVSEAKQFGASLRSALLRKGNLDLQGARREAPRLRKVVPRGSSVTGDPAAPPSPRTAVRPGEPPDPGQRELYASLLDAPALEVDGATGLVEPELLAAGVAPPRPLLASAGALDEMLLAISGGALAAPVAADLSKDGEARTNEEMRALVTRLGGDPLALYRFVHDETDAEPYYGARKGAIGAFAERAGNDADLATLLVALLREAGFAARFEYGTVDLTPEQAMAWTGTTEPGHAADVLQTGGVPSVVLLDGARVKAIRVEHVWVRAYVPYSNYRGVAREGSRPTWVRLDPTLKRARIASAVDVRASVEVDPQQLLDEPLENMPLDAIEAKLRAHVADRGLPCKTLDDLVPSRERIPDGITMLPAELPAPIVAKLATFAAFPSAMRVRGTVTIGSWSTPLDAPSHYGSTVTVRFRGARPADDAAIAAAGGIASLPKPYAVSIVPTLVVDGAERSRGATAVPGTPLELQVQVVVPHAAGWTARHPIFAGGVHALALATGVVGDAVVAAREADLAAAVAQGASGDDLEVAIANRAVWRYQWHANRDAERLLGYFWARPGHGVSEALAGREVEAEELYGTPVTIRPGRHVLDVSRVGWNPYSVDGDDTRLRDAAYLSLWQGSAWEHRVWEQGLHVPAISTVKVLQAARAQGIRVLEIAPSGASVIDALPYSAASRADIRDALHAGRVVVVPERPVTWGVYELAEAYILRDPLTGSGVFRLSGRYSGGEAQGSGEPDPKECPVCSAPDAPAASVVTLSVGNMTFSETDLTVQARGIPVSFARRYDSMSPYGGRLGPGWQHTYEVRLVEEPDGSMLFLNDSFRRQRFLRAFDGAFTPEAGYHEQLEPIAGGGWRVLFKDGGSYTFRSDGQLLAIADSNGHEVRCRYDAEGRLAAVVDAGQREAMVFRYDPAGLLESVTDVAGRVVRFAHESGDLTSVTDVLGNVRRYAYDARHRLASKTDRNGNTTYELYDGEGRWIGSRDPLGYGRGVAYDSLNRRAVHVDKRGSATVWEYSARGNPTAVTDALGNRRVLEWNERHEKTGETDARGYRTTFTYDADGNLLTRTDPLGATTTYTYGPAGRVQTVTDAAGHVTSSTYDDAGNLLTVEDAAGAVTEYDYTADGLPELITQPGGAETALGYASDGRVATLTDAEGGETALGYDAFGHLVSITDALGRTRAMQADAAGRIVHMDDASGARTTFEYDGEGARTAVIDAEGQRTAFAYDGLGRLVAVTDAAGSVTRSEYDPEGNVTARVDARGGRTTYRYDAVGRLVESTDATGNTTTQGYCADVGSQPCAVVDAAGNLTEFEFDAVGRAVKTVDANGTVTEERYDLLGRREWAKDGAGRVTSYGYDAAGRLTKVIDPLGGETLYGYDARGNRTTVTDANGHVTTFAYDRANRLVSETNPIGGVTTYEYDEAGNRSAKVDGNGRRTEYAYDPNRRLTEVRFADGSAYAYAYDARGNRTLEKSPTHERGLAYDALGRLARVEDRTIGRTISYGYDATGNREWMAVDSGETVSYRWDGAGRLAQVTDPEGEVTRFEYDAAGRRERVVYGNGTAASWAHDGAGQVLSIVYANRAGEVLTAFGYAYDAAGNRRWKELADGRREAYGYDGLNRLVAVDYPGGRHVEYAYDAVGNRRSLVDTSEAPVTRWAVSAKASSSHATAKVTGATGAPDQGGCEPNVRAQAWRPAAPGREEWLEVDFGEAERATGIRIHETNSAPFVMRIDLLDDTGAAHTVYEGGDQTSCGAWLQVKFELTGYRVKGARIVTRTTGTGVGAYAAVDAVGLSNVSRDTYEYNGFNQLLAVSGNDGTRTTFGYDGNGNQTSRTDASGLTQYVYDHDNRLAGIALPNGVSNAFEYDANGLRTKKTDSSGTTAYLLDGMSVIAQYGQGGARQAWYTQSLARIDEVLNVVNGQGKFWYQSDALGSVYALANADGTVRARGGYDVFGAAVAEYGQSVGQAFGFTGREHEVDSGLVYYRHRVYEPSNGRFLRPDPIGQAGGPNYYALVRARPTVRTDPSGLMSTMDAYAWKWGVAFLMLAQDLGFLTVEQAVVSAALGGVTILEMTSAMPAGYAGTDDETKACANTGRQQPKMHTYYRGLSRDDVNEWALFGIIQSKFARQGLGDMLAALEYFERGVLNHHRGSDNIFSWADERGPVPSPFVSVTDDEFVAQKFAYERPESGNMVIQLTTIRPGIGPNNALGESEYLMFYAIGIPGEMLEVVP